MTNQSWGCWAGWTWLMSERTSSDVNWRCIQRNGFTLQISCRTEQTTEPVSLANNLGLQQEELCQIQRQIYRCLSLKPWRCCEVHHCWKHWRPCDARVQLQEPFRGDDSWLQLGLRSICSSSKPRNCKIVLCVNWNRALLDAKTVTTSRKNAAHILNEMLSFMQETFFSELTSNEQVTSGQKSCLCVIMCWVCVCVCVCVCVVFDFGLRHQWPKTCI